MGDRMFTPEGDSGYVPRPGMPRLGSAWESAQWESSQWESAQWESGDRREPGDQLLGGPPPRSQGDDVTAGVARRLQARLDRHLWLLDRMAEDPGPEPQELPELLDNGARMRRDTESLLLLCGHEPGVRPTSPRPLDELLSDAAALVEEPHRVEVRHAPEVTVGAEAAVEFLHVLAELVDQTTAAHPGARLDLAARMESGGVTVDVLVEGASWHDPDGLGGSRAVAAAEQLSQRSRYGIDLQSPLGGPPPSGSGLIASVFCPPAVVGVQEPMQPVPIESSNAATDGNGFPAYQNGNGRPGLGDPLGDDFGADRFDDDRFRDDGLSGSLAGLGAGFGNGGFETGLGWTSGLGAGAPNGNGNDLADENGLNGDSGLGDSGLGDSSLGDSGLRGYGLGSDSGLGGNGLGGNGLGNGNGHAPAAPAFSPSMSSQVDELFGPLLDLPLEPLDDRYATPIFEAIASAWFLEGDADPGAGAEQPEHGPVDWETPQDSEWREAAARAARPEPTQSTTATGLPRRRPGNQLVPPPRTQSGLPSGGAAERVPDRVRDRLSTYQRGLRQGRHRAPGEELQEPEDW